jgi:hypothetical protein
MLLIAASVFPAVAFDEYDKMSVETTKESAQQELKREESLGQQDGRDIKTLEWRSPHGELPGTYQEYLISHPLYPACFSTPDDYGDMLSSEQYSLALLVEEQLYADIQVNFEQYLSDLSFEGYSVFAQTVSGGTPVEIKSWIHERYSEGCTAIVFVGDVRAAWAEISGAVFPCDLFYMDLDGLWEDTTGDGIYDMHSAGDGDMGPEVYVGRMYATTLSYDTEACMINEYLHKVHAYRTGELIQPWRGLEYVEEDWYDMDVNLDRIYDDDVVRHDYGYFTTAEDYLDQMDLGQHFVQVCAHSYSQGHHFSTRPTESASYAHVYVHSPLARQAKLLLGSDDGIKVWLNGNNVFTKDRYGSWYPDYYEVDVQLEQGWNQLLCKVSQEATEYKFSAHITDINYDSFDDLSYQLNNPLNHSGEAAFIRGWLCNGFHQDTSQNFWEYLTTNYLGVNESMINPSDGDPMGGKTWTTFTSGNPFINLGDYCSNADFGVCYGFVRVYASNATSCELWMGYDDGARVWLNGEEVLFDNRYGDFEADMTKVNVSLNPGENRLLVKISEWMGTHGFSARLCNTNGSPVDGLQYDPLSPPISHIGMWLINGPYVNPDKLTRLSTDYLGDEGNCTPSEHDPAPFNTWEQGIGNSFPFGLDDFFDHGDWVLSEDIQERDPPVLFYNLFSCGPGRFTDENYLAGSYIFHTTYGLITIASSKSGSMLNFDDFTEPLDQGFSIGESFRLWFDAQAPFQQWEKEWYYGMVVCGDPTLCIPPATTMSVMKPENALYVADKKLLSFPFPLIFGKVTVEVEAYNLYHGIDYVEFAVDNITLGSDSTAPYTFLWDTPAFFRHFLQITAYDTSGKPSSRELKVWKFF